jgi:hypothetical protein
MNRAPEPAPVEVVAGRMKLLSFRHRIAHLRALMDRRPAGSRRRHDLEALLREETTARSAKPDRGR